MLEVDPAVLQDAAAKTAQMHDDLSTRWSALSSRAHELFDGTWQGASARSYRQPWAECTDGFEQVLSSLAMMSEAVATAGRSYQQQDTSSASSIEVSGGPTLAL